jgi:hypothetical protein
MQRVAPTQGQTEAIPVAIGIVARNEEAGIGATLSSLFEQSFFVKLMERGWKCQIFVLANGCTDRTVEVSQQIFDAQMAKHSARAAFQASAVELAERGKINAWNQFVHGLSPKEARYLFLMDSDIIIHRPETLWNMLSALETDPEASIAVDRPCKHLLFKARKSIWDQLSLAVSQLTTSSEAQLCGQLYCIRAAVARNIYLPKDLTACEDGYIKTLVCTDFLTRPLEPRRIRLAEAAEHTFEAYCSPAAIIKNQKRQIMGQTIVHVLVDGYLKNQPPSERTAESLRQKDQANPGWLKDLIREHLHRTRFWWCLYPGMSSLGFKRLNKFQINLRLACLPAALASSVLTLASGLLAFEALRGGRTHYWPQVERETFHGTRSKD